MASSSESISFTVSYRGIQHALAYHPDTDMASLQEKLKELTGVSPSMQKLLYKGKNLLGGGTDDKTLAQSGIKHGLRIQMLGSTSEELTTLESAESEKKKRDQILQERALKAPTKLRSTGTISSGASLQYRFHQLVPLPHLPNPSEALSLLRRLSEDPAIKHIMQKHEFTVGVLTELAPHEDPDLLGLNVNYGQSIKLRLRTNRYDGFRLYSDVRKVLCHELAHNVWRDHDDNFKALNSELNHEVAGFERAAAQGSHTLMGSGDFYVPPESKMDLDVDHGVHIHVLSEGSGLDAPPSNETMAERRRRVLDATMARLRKKGPQ